MSELSKNDQHVGGKIVSGLSDIKQEESAVEQLSGYSVENVHQLLGTIIADKSLSRQERREKVSWTVSHQPHPTKEFTKYNWWNNDIRSKPDIGGSVFSMIMALFSFSFSFLILEGYISAFSISQGDAPLSSMTEAIFGSFFGIAGLVFAFVSICCAIPFPSTEHNKVYGKREHMSANDHAAQIRDNRVKWKRQAILEKQQQLKALTAELSGETVVSSKGASKTSYEEAVARIASYETDIDKALRYPAFNDITVKEVREMVLRMRTCKSMVENLEAEDARELSKEVDELWVCIQTAEETAKRIGLKSLDAEELKLLDKIKGLVAHAGDPTYSDDVRAGFYEKLRTAVNRLNENKTVIPTKIVAEIESKAVKTLTMSKEEEAAHA